MQTPDHPPPTDPPTPPKRKLEAVSFGAVPIFQRLPYTPEPTRLPEPREDRRHSLGVPQDIQKPSGERRHSFSGSAQPQRTARLERIPPGLFGVHCSSPPQTPPPTSTSVRRRSSIITHQADMTNGGSERPEVCFRPSHGMSRPVPLLHCNSWDGQEMLKLDDEAERWLQKIGHQKLIVVSFVGGYRTGKSFLLNAMLGAVGRRSGGGFPVGSSVRACTRGAWMWAVTADSDDTVFLFVDFEGLGDFNKTAEHDAKLFTLAVIMSNYVCFNSRGIIDEHSINQLSLVARLAQYVKQNARESIPTLFGGDSNTRPSRASPRGTGQSSPLSVTSLDSNNRSRDFMPMSMPHQWHPPPLLWVLRDFFLSLVDEKMKPITASEYLEMSLGDDATASMRGRTRSVRDDILSTFRQRSCATLVQPVIDEDLLQTLDSVEIRELREEFISQMRGIKSQIFADAEASAKSQLVLSGRSFIRVLERYIKHLNAGGLPDLCWTWDEVQREECEKAVAKGGEEHRLSLSRLVADFPVDDAVLRRHMRMARDEAVKIFHEVAVGEELITNQYKRQMKEFMANNETKILAEHHRTSEVAIDELLGIWTRKIKAAFETDADLSVESIDQQLAEFRMKFRAEAIGSDEIKERKLEAATSRLQTFGSRQLLQREIRAKDEALLNSAKEKAQREEKLRIQAEAIQAQSDHAAQIDTEIDKSRSLLETERAAKHEAEEEVRGMRNEIEELRMEGCDVNKLLDKERMRKMTAEKRVEQLLEENRLLAAESAAKRKGCAGCTIM